MPRQSCFFPPKARFGTVDEEAITNVRQQAIETVVLGKGPFMLQDSRNLVSRALKRLGYMDDSMNSDLFEAMLVFMNAPETRYTLRKSLDTLRILEYTFAEAEEKLRGAFLSHHTDAQWRTAPRDGEVRNLLQKQGFLTTAKAAPKDVFLAITRYSRKQYLPKMKTYNGLVFRSLRSMDSSPTNTGTIEITDC